MFLTEHILYVSQILKMLLSYVSIRSLKNNSIRQKNRKNVSLGTYFVCIANFKNAPILCVF